jgi:hypothetical protein
MKDYPPYSFKEGPQLHLNVKPLVELSGMSDYKSKDGLVTAHLKEPRLFDVDFYLKAGKTLLACRGKTVDAFPCAIYKADLDNNGLEDFIIFYNYRGCGLGAHQDKVEIFLKKNSGGYRKISYDTFDAGLEDFIGPGTDGKYKIIMTGFYNADRHNYFSYNIYEFKSYRLVNSDSSAKGFPKFIWYTNRANDKNTAQLTGEERALYIREKNSSFLYEDIN